MSMDVPSSSGCFVPRSAPKFDGAGKDANTTAQTTTHAATGRDADVAAPARNPGVQLRIKQPTLAEVMAYSNRDVVYRFKKNYGLSWEASADIFDQVKKWLWLANYRRSVGINQGLSIDLSLVVIDEMWHNFVLFTKEYTQFCTHYFGYYLHHGPATEAEESDNRERFSRLQGAERMEAVKAAKRPQYEYIYDHLGEETLIKWYVDYPKLYGYRRLAELQLQAVNENLSKVPGRPLHESSRQQPIEK